MNHSRTPEEVEDRLWKEIEKVRYGMLGLVGEGTRQHFQPMTAFCEPANGQIWFFTRKDSDLARAIGDGGKSAMFTVTAKDQEFQACISGTLTVEYDRERIDEYWNSVVAAWFEGGKDDPSLTLIRYDLDDAAVWLSEAGPLRFFLEILKANATGKKPNVGEHAEIRLN